MIDFIVENSGTICVGALMLGLCTLAIWKLRRDKKKGAGGCGHGCACCPKAGHCHDERP